MATTAPKFRSPYNGTTVPVRLSFEGTEAITQQHFKAEVDVHNILKQYDRTGLITHVNEAAAAYGDYTEINEYKESLERVIAAQDAFSEIPSHIRKRFGNDPGEFFEFVTNPANHDELVNMGLANPKVVVEAQTQTTDSAPPEAV